jgi:hypothetical protein
MTVSCVCSCWVQWPPRHPLIKSPQKNGHRFTGAIVSGNTKTVLLKTEFAGDITISLSPATTTSSLIPPFRRS